MLGAELTHHLGYASGQKAPEAGGNCRNGYSEKTLVAHDDQSQPARGCPEECLGVNSAA